MEENNGLFGTAEWNGERSESGDRHQRGTSCRPAGGDAGPVSGRAVKTSGDGT